MANKSKLDDETILEAGVETTQEQDKLTSAINPSTTSSNISSGVIKFLPWILLIVVVVVSGFLVVSQFKKAKKLSQEVVELKQSPQQAVQEQAKELLDKVGKLIILPADEEPTIATVTDLKPLQDQPFFKNAKLGDKVLIYSVSKKAVLYREDQNIVVEVAPINFDNNPAGATGTNPEPVTKTTEPTAKAKP